MKGLFGKVLSKAFEHADNIFREASAALSHHQLNYILWIAPNYLIQPDLSSRKPAVLNESIWEFYRVLYHYATFANWIKLYIYIIQISHICEVQSSRKSLVEGIFCRPFRATVEPPRTLFSHACVHGTVNFAVKPNRRANKHGTNMYGTKVSACQSSNKDASVMLRREW